MSSISSMTLSFPPLPASRTAVPINARALLTLGLNTIVRARRGWEGHRHVVRDFLPRRFLGRSLKRVLEPRKDHLRYRTLLRSFWAIRTKHSSGREEISDARLRRRFVLVWNWGRTQGVDGNSELPALRPENWSFMALKDPGLLRFLPECVGFRSEASISCCWRQTGILTKPVKCDAP